MIPFTQNLYGRRTYVERKQISVRWADRNGKSLLRVRGSFEGDKMF
jgi:hypothetical protein